MNRKRTKKAPMVTIPGTVPMNLYVRRGKITIDATELQQVVRRAVYDANREFADILTHRHPEITIRLKALLAGEDPLLRFGANLSADKRHRALETIILKAITVAMDEIRALEFRSA